MNCPICGERIRITDPEHLALSRSPFMSGDILCDECLEAEAGQRDTLVDVQADLPDAVAVRGAL